MTAFAGDIISASDVNRRIATTTGTSDSSATSGTTELAVDQVTAIVVQGRRYVVTWDCPWLGSVGADIFFLLLREGSGTGGAQLDFVGVKVQAATIPQETSIVIADWTASTSGSFTFTSCLRRSSGTGTITAKGASNQPRVLKVDLAD